VTQAKRRAATAARLPFDDSPQYLCRSQKMRLPWAAPKGAAPAVMNLEIVVGV